MSGMNFIPAVMAQQQRNKKILNKSGSALIVCGTVLLLSFLSLNTYNQYLTDRNAQLTATKDQINNALQERDDQKAKLKEIRRVAANLDQLNSFSALSQALDMLNISIPDETELNTLQTEINQSGETLIMLDGVADSHKNLTTWVTELQAYSGVKSAELTSSNSIQSAAADELKQRFSLRIIKAIHRDTSS